MNRKWLDNETLAKFFDSPGNVGDNQQKLDTLCSDLIDFYGVEEATALMDQWINEHRNYFDFQIHRPKEQPSTDNDILAPSMQAIDHAVLSIKAYILSRIAYRMKSGGDHQTINIRVTMDDGIERRNTSNE